MPTYTPLQSIQLTTSASSVTFSGIPQNYQDLVLVCQIQQVTDGEDVAIQVNGDTNTNYSRTYLCGDGSTGHSARDTSYASIRIDHHATPPTSSSFSTNIVNFENYSNTTTNKTILARSNSLSTYAGTVGVVGLWRNTNAITSITVFCTNSSNMKTGSTFDLYGISPVAADTAQAFGGTEIYYDSSYVYHVFKGSGTFIPYRNLTVDALVIAGGGGGANMDGTTAGGGGGGGGAGGFRSTTSLAVTSGTSYTITVGAGGSGGINSVNSTNGSDSIFSTITSTGGGRGAGNGTSTYAAGNGGSGGGGGYWGAAGTGNTPSTSPSQGNNGAGAQNAAGGGGGGAGSAGSGTNGGSGNSSFSSWASVTSTGVSGSYAGGGGGGGTTSGAGPGTGGSGGGGNGGITSTNNATSGVNNTGSGGGGAGGNIATAGSGGSGLVIVRYAR